MPPEDQDPWEACEEGIAADRYIDELKEVLRGIATMGLDCPTTHSARDFFRDRAQQAVDAASKAVGLAAERAYPPARTTMPPAPSIPRRDTDSDPQD